MNRSVEVEIKVGLFVALGIALIMLTVLLLGGGQSIFERMVTYHAEFGEIEGLAEGATVKMSGVRVGQVSKILFKNDTGRVLVDFKVKRQFADAIHQDASVGIQTQGVLGDRYIIVNPGTPGSTIAKEDMELKADAPRDFKTYLSDADEVLGRLKKSLGHMEGILGSFNREQRAEQFFKNMSNFSSTLNDSSRTIKSSSDHLKSIMTKIDHGHGTIGALINDPTLYEDLKTLLGGANRNRVLKYFVRKSVEESREAREDAEKKKK
jgi:phospholipid/cholesterol/gamma-HCH transport system substrate-binding protein